MRGLKYNLEWQFSEANEKHKPDMHFPSQLCSYAIQPAASFMFLSYAFVLN